MRLRSKLILGNLGLAAAMLLVAQTAEEISYGALEEVLLEGSDQQAQHVLDEVERHIQARVGGLQALSNNPTLQGELRRSNEKMAALPDIQGTITAFDRKWRETPAEELSGPLTSLMTNSTAAALRAHLEAVERQAQAPVFGEIFVTNRYGINIGQTGRTTDLRQDDEQWWQRAREEGVHIGNPRVDASSKMLACDLCLRIDAPDSTMLGVLKATFDVGELSRLLESRAATEGVGMTLFDGSGRVVHSAGRQFADTTAEPLMTSRQAPADTLCARWQLEVRQGTAEALARAREVGSRVRWASIACAAFTMLLSVITVMSLARRLDHIRDATRRVRSGDLSVRIGWGLRDEVDELAGSFDRMTAQLEDARRAADASRSAKDAFLANMSHEIRTPITAVVACADLLLEDDLRPAQRDEFIQTIRTSSQHLTSLINGILDLSKIGAGKLSIERIECSPAHIAYEVIELMNVQARSKDLPLELELLNPVPTTMYTDPTRLRQILVNLVGNAVKFTDHGSVRLCAGVEGGDLHPKLLLHVIDSGLGMTPDQIERILSPFEQADMSTTRQFGGTGLGLSISNELALALGGSLTIESELGHGSTFTLALPLGEDAATSTFTSVDEIVVRSEQSETDGLATFDRQRPLRGIRVLLAEDVPVNQRLLSAMLTRAGAIVEVADNGKTAVERVLAIGPMISEPPIDLVLMDLMMPVVDGFAAVRELRRQGHTGPVVALSADGMESTRERCLTTGFDHFVTKPIGRNSLEQAVMHALEKAPRAVED